MREIPATITSKGQLTLPAEVRRHLGLKTRDRVVFVIAAEPDSVKLRAPRYPDLASLRGAAGSLARPMPWKEMLDIAREDRSIAGHADQE